jgi:hypothetical protein
VDAPAIVDDITAGAFDDDLPELVAAIRGRYAEVGSYWRVDFDGLDVTEQNITIAEAKLVERMAQTQLRFIDPASSVTQAAAIVQAAMMERRDMKPAIAEESLRRVTANDLSAACSRYVADLPKDSGPPTTPEDSTGSPTSSP